MNRLHSTRHEVHEQVVAESLRRSEVGFAAAHCTYFLNELHEGEVAGQHESVDHDVRALTACYFVQRLGDDEWVEAKGVFIDAAIGKSERAGLTVRDHDDLLHILVLAGKDALSQTEAFAGVRVVRAYLDTGELGDRDLFGRVVEEDEVEGVSGELGADQMRERHGNALGRSETVFAVKNHGMGAVE